MANLYPSGTPDKPASNVVPLPVEQRYSCVLVISNADTGEQLLIVKVDHGSRFEMERLGALLHANPTLAIAKGMHLFGAALGALYEDRGVNLASSYATAQV